MQNEKTVGVIGLGLMGEVLASRLMAAGFGVRGYDIDPAKNARLWPRGRGGGGIARRGRSLRRDRARSVQHRSGRGGGRASDCCRRWRRARSCSAPRPATRTGSRRWAGGSRAPRLRFLETPVSGTSEQVRQGDGVGLIGGDPKTAAEVEASPRRAVSAALSHRQDRRRRPRQARGQSDPRTEPHGAGGGADLRRAHGARSQGVPRGGEGRGVLFAGDGDQGRKNAGAGFRAGGPRQADAQGRAHDARTGREARAGAAGAQGALRRAGGLRARRRGRARQQHHRRGDRGGARCSDLSLDPAAPAAFDPGRIHSLIIGKVLSC